MNLPRCRSEVCSLPLFGLVGDIISSACFCLQRGNSITQNCSIFAPGAVLNPTSRLPASSSRSRHFAREELGKECFAVSLSFSKSRGCYCGGRDPVAAGEGQCSSAVSLQPALRLRSTSCLFKHLFTILQPPLHRNSQKHISSAKTEI